MYLLKNMVLFCGYKICIIFRIKINTYQGKGKYGGREAIWLLKLDNE
jgi:hypothetical protein